MAFIGTGLPSTPARVDCLTRPDFLFGGSNLAVSDVFFLFISFGDGAVFSEVDVVVFPVFFFRAFLNFLPS